jgi:hypothetical protein
LIFMFCVIVATCFAAKKILTRNLERLFWRCFLNFAFVNLVSESIYQNKLFSKPTIFHIKWRICFNSVFLSKELKFVIAVAIW